MPTSILCSSPPQGSTAAAPPTATWHWSLARPQLSHRSPSPTLAGTTSALPSIRSPSSSVSPSTAKPMSRRQPPPAPSIPGHWSLGRTSTRQVRWTTPSTACSTNSPSPTAFSPPPSCNRLLACQALRPSACCKSPCRQTHPLRSPLSPTNTFSTTSSSRPT